MSNRISWIRNTIVRQCGRSIAWIFGGYVVLSIIVDISGFISGESQSTIAKAAVKVVEKYHEIPVIGTGVGAAISKFGSAAIAFFIIILLWVTREKNTQADQPKIAAPSERQLRKLGRWTPWGKPVDPIRLSEAIKTLIPPPQKLDPIEGPAIIAKRKDSARILRELAEKMWGGIDILKNKRVDVAKIYKEVNRDIEKLCSKRRVHSWQDLNAPMGPIDKVAPEKIDEWIRDHRDWLLREAKDYDQQADLMEKDGHLH
jgi:hypothetical protein